MDRLLSMRVFQRVVDEGGFAAAARALEMSPAVVTRLVADLEEHLGTRLLHRTTRRVALSEAGEAYVTRVRAILQDIDEADGMASVHTQAPAGVLRLAAAPVLATHVLAPLVQGFRAAYPKITLDIEVASWREVAIEDFDITLMTADAAFDGDVIARKVISSNAILVAAPSYLQRQGTPAAPAELSRHDILRLSIQGEHPRNLTLFLPDDAAARVDVEVQPVLWSSHPDVLLRATLDGAGITATSVDLVAPYLAQGALVRVLAPWIASRLTLYAALPSRKFMPLRTQLFLEYLSTQTRQAVAVALGEQPHPTL